MVNQATLRALLSPETIKLVHDEFNKLDLSHIKLFIPQFETEYDIHLYADGPEDYDLFQLSNITDFIAKQLHCTVGVYTNGTLDERYHPRAPEAVSFSANKLEEIEKFVTQYLQVEKAPEKRKSLGAFFKDKKSKTSNSASNTTTLELSEKVVTSLQEDSQLWGQLKVHPELLSEVFGNVQEKLHQMANGKAATPSYTLTEK